MKQWQTYLIVWAVLIVGGAVRSLHPHPSLVYSLSSLTLAGAQLVFGFLFFVAARKGE